MLVFKTSLKLKKFLDSKGVSVGLIPTMGALHTGHLSLVERAFEENDYVVISIYINPTQFNNLSDFKNYPQNQKKDISLLKPFRKKIIVYIPENKEIYPNGIKSNSYDFGSLDQHMEGKFRDNHFNGVATVVEALFKNTTPNKAYFGEKDFQQFKIIKSLVEQKRINTKLILCPIVREKNGLALSSRNKHLNSIQKKLAPSIYSTLKKIKRIYNQHDVSELEKIFINQIEDSKQLKVEYFSIASENDLIPVKKIINNKNFRVFVAVYIGQTRLIDNIKLY
tara:strand:+ start:4 stop:843 length:840 start_codon:yes stop_codon:yes gene_type:complete